MNKKIIFKTLLFCVTLLIPFSLFGQDFSINGTVLVKYRGDADHVTIPEGITAIGNQAFFLCSLTSVTIPTSVTSIGENAFLGCNSLASVNIPAGVASIGYGAFLNCSSLTGITVDMQNRAYSSEEGILFNKRKTALIQYPAGKPERSYTIPAGVTSIESYAFSDCNKLTSVTIPASVTSIGTGAFKCLNLRSITVDSQNPSFSSEAGVLFNRNKTILIQYPAGKTSGTYTVPDSVTSISGSAFIECINLTSITIPASVASIGDFAFEECNNLQTVVISRKTKLGEGVFPDSVRITYSD